MLNKLDTYTFTSQRLLRSSSYYANVLFISTSDDEDWTVDAIITYCIMLLHEDVRTFVPTVRCIDSGRMIQSSSNVILWSPHAHIVCLSQQCVMCVVWVSFSISESLNRIFRTSLTTSMCKSLKCLTSINIQSVVS